MEDQDEFLMRNSNSNSECTDVDVETNTRAQLEDVGQNADLYIANQEASTLGPYMLVSIHECA